MIYKYEVLFLAAFITQYLRYCTRIESRDMKCHLHGLNDPQGLSGVKDISQANKNFPDATG